MEEVFSELAAAKEWGAIILLISVIWFYMRSMFKANSEREERLVDAFLSFSNEIPKLSQSLDDLRNWLISQFGSVNEDLDTIKGTQKETNNVVKDHENRIGALEDHIVPVVVDENNGKTAKNKRRGKKQ